jgi:hypothetical protein
MLDTFAATAIVDYFLFADQGKQTSVFRFRFRKTKRSLPLPFSVCRKQTEVAVYMETWRHQMENGSPGGSPSFVHRANRSLSFVRLLTKKQTEVIRLQTDEVYFSIYGCRILQYVRQRRTS